MSVEKLLQILEALDYAYPYHQSIGFYMKRASFPEHDIDLVRKLGTPFNFYVGHGMRAPAFDEDFRVFYPKTPE